MVVHGATFTHRRLNNGITSDFTTARLHYVTTPIHACLVIWQLVETSGFPISGRSRTLGVRVGGGGRAGLALVLHLICRVATLLAGADPFRSGNN